MNDFGERLRQARGLKGITQAALANYAGSSRSMIAAYEAGRRYPKDTTMFRLSQYLGVSFEWLRSGEGNPEDRSGSLWRTWPEDLSSDTAWFRDSRGYIARPFRIIPLLLSTNQAFPIDFDWPEPSFLPDRCLPIDDRLSARLGRRAFAVYALGDAMRPVLKDKDIAIADRDYAPTPGNLIVAWDKLEKRLIVRRYKQSRDKNGIVHELVPEDPYWPSLALNEHLEIVGVIQALLVFPTAYAT